MIRSATETEFLEIKQFFLPDIQTNNTILYKRTWSWLFCGLETRIDETDRLKLTWDQVMRTEMATCEIDGTLVDDKRAVKDTIGWPDPATGGVSVSRVLRLFV